MIKVLVFTYNFPPEGGPAVQRITKFIKYLIKLEVKVFVLTARKKNKIIDETFLQDTIDSKVTTTIDCGSKIGGDLKKIFWRFFIPDKSALWKHTAVKAAMKLIRKEKIDIIFSTSPPHSTHLIAEKIAQRTKIKWIVDFRDEWVDNSLFNRARLIQRQKDMEQGILNNCNHVIAVTETARENFSHRINSEKITVIPNGFDEEDFTHIKTHNSNYLKNSLIIAYAGRLNELHSPHSLFKAFSSLVINNELDTDKISVEIIGNLENAKWLQDYPELINIIKFQPYMPHDKLLEHLNKADVLLLLATNMNSTEFFPAKMFEYFRLRKNIFAIISSKGELWNSISEYGNSYLSIDSNIDQIKDSILKLVSDFTNHRFNDNFNNEFIESFSRKKQAQKLYNLFANLLT